MDCGRRLGGEVGVGTGIVAEIRVEAWSVHAQFRGPALAPGLLSTRYSVGHNTTSQIRLRALSEARTHAHVPSHLARGLQPGTPLHCRSSPATHQGADPPREARFRPAELSSGLAPSSQLPWFRGSPTGILKPRPRPFRFRARKCLGLSPFNLPASLSTSDPFCPGVLFVRVATSVRFGVRRWYSGELEQLPVESGCWCPASDALLRSKVSELRRSAEEFKCLVR